MAQPVPDIEDSNIPLKGLCPNTNENPAGGGIIVATTKLGMTAS